MKHITALAAIARRIGRWLTGADLPPADRDRIAAWAIAARITGGDPTATALLADQILRTTPTTEETPMPTPADEYHAWREQR